MGNLKVVQLHNATKTGNVTGAYYSMGGFTAGSYGTISQSFSTGNLYLYGYGGGYDNYYIGGFDGFSEYPLINDYSSGNIIIDSSVVGADAYYIGGFDGYSRQQQLQIHIQRDL